MKRANTFVLAPTRTQEAELRRRATSCAKLWNEVNYQRRQAYTNYQPIDWNSQTYKKYVPHVGSSTAQQVVRKNSEAWRSFLVLKRLERLGKLPPHVKKVSPPGYWKRDGRYELVILCRNDSYRIYGETLRLSGSLWVRFRGNLRWSGKQGRLEIRYDQLTKKWRVFQPVVVKLTLSPRGSKTCHIDLGVRNLGTVLVEDWSKPIAFNAGNLLADWWYWTKRIAAHQARLWRINRRKTSKTLRRLYWKRQKRFRHAVDAFARQLIKELHDLGVSRIVLGDLNRIRLNNEDRRPQANAMVHNFWSHEYLAKRIRCTGEEHGITVVKVSEAHTSDTCPRCRSRNCERRGRLFRCLSCGLEAHRDAVGVVNMASLTGERAVGAMAHPMLLRWDGCWWKPSRAMPTQRDELPRSKNLPTLAGRVPATFYEATPMFFYTFE
jgi:putative transposase